MNAMNKIVIKVGTSTLTKGTEKLSRAHMLTLVQQMAHLHARNLQIVLVSSGAVATGRDLFHSPSSGQTQPTKETYASMGQVKLMQVWTELFSLFELHVGQVLLTKGDFSQERKPFTRQILMGLIRHQIIPIINENDILATEGIRIGDNDNLAALVANLIEADALILLTDQEGLYTADPRSNPDAKLIHAVKEINEEIFALGGASSTTLGTGGMGTKIQAAQTASNAGTKTIVASSFRRNILIDLANGEEIGTVFLGKEVL